MHWLHYTTGCNTQSSIPEDGRNHRPKHDELIEIVNKPLIVASSWLSVLFVSMMHGPTNIKQQYNNNNNNNNNNNLLFRYVCWLCCQIPQSKDSGC